MSSTITVSSVAEAGVLASAYPTATADEKRAIRAALVAYQKSLMATLDPDAFMVFALVESLAPAKPTAAPVDHVALTADLVATLRGLADGIESGTVRPSGVPDDADLSEVSTRTGTVNPDWTTRLVGAVRVARSSDSVDIAEVIEKAFATVEVGTFLSIADIARLGEHPRGSGASGAIAARLFADGGCTVDGVTPAERTADRPRGAIKA